MAAAPGAGGGLVRGLGSHADDLSARIILGAGPAADPLFPLSGCHRDHPYGCALMAMDVVWESTSDSVYATQIAPLTTPPEDAGDAWPAVSRDGRLLAWTRLYNDAAKTTEVLVASLSEDESGAPVLRGDPVVVATNARFPNFTGPSGIDRIYTLVFTDDVTGTIARGLVSTWFGSVVAVAGGTVIGPDTAAYGAGDPLPVFTDSFAAPGSHGELAAVIVAEDNLYVQGGGSLHVSAYGHLSEPATVVRDRDSHRVVVVAGPSVGGDVEELAIHRDWAALGAPTTGHPAFGPKGRLIASDDNRPGALLRYERSSAGAVWQGAPAGLGQPIERDWGDANTALNATVNSAVNSRYNAASCPFNYTLGLDTVAAPVVQAYAEFAKRDDFLLTSAMCRGFKPASSSEATLFSRLYLLRVDMFGRSRYYDLSALLESAGWFGGAADSMTATVVP